MRDLKSTKAMWLKAWLFLLIGVMAGALLLIEHWSWRAALLLGLCVWGFSRFYYFAFYVIERWVDGRYRFSGLCHFMSYALRKRADLDDPNKGATISDHASKAQDVDREAG